MKLIEIRDLVLEGLIKVPPDMLKSLCHHIYSEFLSYMAQAKDGKYKDDAEKIAAGLGEKIDDNFKPENMGIDVNTTLEGIPEKVKNAWRLEFGYLKLMIDWEQKIWKDRPKVNASYEESDVHGLPGYFTVNPKSFMDLLGGDEYSMRKVVDIFEKIKTSMWHESSHAIQHNALKWMDKAQVGKSRIIRDDPKSSKEDQRREYLSAAVEFDPQIKTKILKFKKIAEKEPKDVLKNLAIFVSATQVEGKKPDEFFDALKKMDFKRWKKGVKLFYLNYGFDVTSLLEPPKAEEPK